MKTPEVKAVTPRGGSPGTGAAAYGKYRLPSWVQVETLHPGQVFVSDASFTLSINTIAIKVS